MDKLKAQVPLDAASIVIGELTPESYQEFLTVKSLPRYDIQPSENNHWLCTFPPEYLHKFGQEYYAPECPLPLDLPDFLFDYQRVIIQVAWRKKRYACFADAGLGKTNVFLELARQLASIGKKTLIVTPLNILHQTMEEALKFYGSQYPQIVNLWARETYEGIGPNSIEDFCKSKLFKVGIVNYDKFRTPKDLTGIDCIVIDESGILKSETGVIRTNLIQCSKGIEYKFCFSATPAPNDRIEYAQHAVFLEMLRSANEMYALFFVNKDNKWVLKRHASEAFYRFLSGWSIFIRSPKAYGFEDNLKDLPPWKEIKVQIPMTREQTELVHKISQREQLVIPGLAQKPDGMKERGQYSQISKGFLYKDGRKETVLVQSKKPKVIREIVESHPGEQTLVWTVFDEEGEILYRELCNNTNLKVVHLTGKTPQAERIRLIDDFRHGKIDVMISKPRILGFGLNFQNCTVMVFSGLADSFEMYYQAIKRCHRYGQKKQLKVYLPHTPHEGVILQNVLRKKKRTEADFAKQERLYIDSLYDELQEFLEADYVPPLKEETMRLEPIITDQYQLYHCDSIKAMLDGLAKNSIDFAIFSPPFRNDLYAYTQDIGDMGNSGGIGEAGKQEFMLHFAFFLKGLYKAMKPGRLVACHVMQSPLRKGLDGIVGISDFRGDVIRAFCKHGFFQFGEVVILKNPQAQSIVKHINSLQMSTLARDRAQIVPSFPDYLLIFKKPGENEVAIQSDEVSSDEWIEDADAIWQEKQYNAPGRAVPQRARFDEYFDNLEASVNEQLQTLAGVWYDIRETDVIKCDYTTGRTKESEDADKHICPLQLGLINRAIRLWSNPAETVLDPFCGIGSSGVEAIKLGRKFVGVELKTEYFISSKEHLEQAVEDSKQKTLFDFAGVTI